MVQWVLMLKINFSSWNTFESYSYFVFNLISFFSFVYILLNVKYTLKQAKNFITSSLLLIFIFCHKDSSLHTENALWSTSEYFIITILSKEKREWWDSLRLILPFVDNDINYHFQVASLKNDLLKILTDSACALQVRVKIPLGRC